MSPAGRIRDKVGVDHDYHVDILLIEEHNQVWSAIINIQDLYATM